LGWLVATMFALLMYLMKKSEQQNWLYLLANLSVIEIGMVSVYVKIKVTK
jgi:hypothetical protein